MQEPRPPIIRHKPNSGIAAFQAGIDCVPTDGIHEIILVAFCGSDDVERVLQNQLDHRTHDISEQRTPCKWKGCYGERQHQLFIQDPKYSQVHPDSHQSRVMKPR
jgi:hypothetical protein